MQLRSREQMDIRLTTLNTGTVATTGTILGGLLGGSALVARAASTTISEGCRRNTSQSLETCRWR